MNRTLTVLSGSEHPATATTTMMEKSHPDERLTVTVKLKSKDESGLDENTQRVDHAAFKDIYGADPLAVCKVVEYGSSHGLIVTEVNLAERQVVFSGTVTQFESAFLVDLHQFEHDGGTFRGHLGGVYVPADLEGDIEAVLGLNNRQVAKPHFLYLMGVSGLANHGSQPQPFNPSQVAKLYNFPNGSGVGQTVAILELGGGYTPRDMKRYFSSQGHALPSISNVSVGGATNSPGSDADGEVGLDIQIVGCVAPGAKIVVYFAPNTSQGFVEAITDAAHDAKNKPSVISISWGGPESQWSASDRTALNNAVRDAGRLGVTVTVASGDAGSNDGIMDGQAHCDFPASSPYTLACGGTQLIGTTSITTEAVWNNASDSAGGGGISHNFSVPSYQTTSNHVKSANEPSYVGRGVPDVSGNADPNSGYNVLVDGQPAVVGGTSAVAPLWAGLIALLNQALGRRLGFVNPALYANTSAFHQITVPGNNGHYNASPSDKWNAVTGLGTPDGVKLLAALKK